MALCAVLAAVGISAEAAVLHSTNFEVDPESLGWGSSAPTSNQGNAWTTAAAFSPAHSIRAVDALWYSPAFSLATFELYSARFRALAYGRGFAGAGSDVGCVYSEVPWAQNVALFRGEIEDSPEMRVYFKPPPGGMVYVDDVSIEALDRPSAAAVFDELVAALPPYTFAAETGRHAHLSRVKSLLSTGQTVRTVMLGDSIINGISHSYFESLVDRMYPGSRMEIATKVRGSTGCWWYRENDPETGRPRVEEWVASYNPDLVILGGISHGSAGLAYEIEACRDVIDTVRTYLPNVEFLLLTEAAGWNDPYRHPELAEPFDPQGTDWRARLSTLAAEEGVEFLDLNRWWARYIIHSGHSDDWFKGDLIHMNQRGSVVTGLALAAYFAPTSPDPDADGIPSPNDPCPNDPGNDVDRDGICAATDLDDDGDANPDAIDCAPESAIAWTVPGEVSACTGGSCLLVERQGSAAVLHWSPPIGGTVFWYDVLNATSAAALATSTSCVEAADGANLEATDAGVPPPGTGIYYVVRARNLCGLGPAGGSIPPGAHSCP